jgi:signal transduction histidine kinase
VMKNRAAMALRSEHVSADVRAHVEEIASAASQAVQHAREMSHGLRPYQLKHLGLGASLVQLAESVSAASAVEVAVGASDIEGGVGEDAAIQVYRIVQEALNNILKHADASRVSVTLTPRGAGVDLQITDNGRGMDTDKPFGFGLTGIQQRVQLLGGTLAVRSAPGAGTTLEAFLPGETL